MNIFSTTYYNNIKDLIWSLLISRKKQDKLFLNGNTYHITKFTIFQPKSISKCKEIWYNESVINFQGENMKFLKQLLEVIVWIKYLL